ncbi:helix-turn-helix domain-containing protein [Cysteiniphilum litorale]|uniref:helix-turn-helix domain-containing protein n=1 Tax=Cysteiniphilum litorale TaxID=2056700 RepID=UPI003F8836C4
MAAQKNILDDIFKKRSDILRNVMKEYSINSLKKLSELSGIDPSKLSLVMSGKTTLNESNARQIETKLNLPLYYLDGISKQGHKIPVYTIESYKNKEELFYIDMDANEDSFFIIITESIAKSSLQEGTKALFIPMENISLLKLNDICLVKYKNLHHIVDYKITLFKNNHLEINLANATLIGKCISIHL